LEHTFFIPCGSGIARNERICKKFNIKFFNTMLLWNTTFFFRAVLGLQEMNRSVIGATLD
jgi:hypothetical protein